MKGSSSSINIRGAIENDWLTRKRKNKRYFSLFGYTRSDHKIAELAELNFGNKKKKRKKSGPESRKVG